MSASTSYPLGRSRSLRVPANNVKPTLTSTQASAGPSNITLFLTNLRLLDFDLRVDWPDITALTFSTKEAQQNQKRIQCVEWALYQLFAIWDPEETRNKLQPFFPPLEQLQSLNLRTALFRCLDQAKKNGVLGRNTVLRKTMLDECKGERLQEVLGVFSNVVFKKVVQEDGSEHHQTISRRLALENFSYSGERTVLRTLIVAHKSNLIKHLNSKKETAARYRNFSNLMDLNERRLVRRHEQLKQTVEEGGPQKRLEDSDLKDLHEKTRKNWSGTGDWLDAILYGDSRAGNEGLMATSFEKVWTHVGDGDIGDVEGKQHSGLLEQLDSRVKDQEARLARWKEFGKTLSKGGSISTSKAEQQPAQKKKIDLGFNAHQSLQLGHAPSKASTNTVHSLALSDYTRLIENMRNELAGIDKPKPQKSRRTRESLMPPKSHFNMRNNSPSRERSSTANDEAWSSASSDPEVSTEPESFATKSISRTPPPEDFTVDESRRRTGTTTSTDRPVEASDLKVVPEENQQEPEKARITTTSTMARNRTPSPKATSRNSHTNSGPPDPETELADQILDSMAAASPSPKKPRHTLTLAERTRLSMSRASHSQFFDLHEASDGFPDFSRSPTKSRSRGGSIISPTAEEGPEKHADLIERTRKSMAGFEAAQKKAHLDRRKSQKAAAKKDRQRASSYFPRVEEEVGESASTGIDLKELIEGEADFESVFKSRPKIKTSPAVSPAFSPTRAWEGE